LAAARYALEKYPDSVYLGEVATNEIIQHFALMETKSDGISYLEQFSHSHEGTEAAAFAVLAAGRLHITSNENALAEETWSKFLADPAHQRAVAIPAIEDELTQLRVHMARAATKDGQHVAAVHSFELALGNPRWSLLCREAGSELADAYEAAGRYDNAVTMLRRLQQNEHGPRAVLSLRFREADALCRGGRTQEALCTYEDVMKAAGGDERLRAACLAGIAFSEGGLAPTR
jgi:tetratricopeptide (TPR) repeat protein